jgi:hypothetical protein
MRGSLISTRGLPGSNPCGYTLVGTRVIFAANDGSTGNEIWRIRI